MYKSKLIVTLGGLLLLMTCGFTVEQPVKKNRAYYEARDEIVWEVPMKEKLVALTFDDGPNSRTTPQILDLLLQNETKSTFFIVGKRAERFPDIVKREALEGHEVANHTYSHMYLNSNVSEAKITDELVRTQNKIFELTGQKSPWFRPPGGVYNESVVRIAREKGYKMVLWSWHQDTKDWRSPGTQKIINKVLHNIRNGDIILFHDHVDGSIQTVEALKVILPELKKRGYKMVTVSELIQHRQSKSIQVKPRH
ncbi:polysaccharide deacetylase family protein [Cohnella abietis]|uniref:Polysaccharide deacetylase family sporulation protein PdaB n=1 Tax=Cohnella abietis TaxID=2507935 RepID=A0A3T1D1V7_9BACL|nr:polysaccharide deacetylase family protein [Cohnella abietis]BBI31995.1 polysaccharide deacetylase family sporulation protein PdaB [Cohnella abietis]